ncbi:hypothetical protein FHU37_001742 [Allostreptomyces psammosilenae]|uniref:Uncharacterized protein n=1 Tax=Allostreptomyces psammosilenae TaxID=1892865 RepID=A0A852ZQZ1_9ACTN|nr:hypothetical protein [Allostreptomyces psammosilenae]
MRPPALGRAAAPPPAPADHPTAHRTHHAGPAWPTHEDTP